MEDHVGSLKLTQRAEGALGLVGGARPHVGRMIDALWAPPEDKMGEIEALGQLRTADLSEDKKNVESEGGVESESGSPRLTSPTLERPIRLRYHRKTDKTGGRE